MLSLSVCVYVRECVSVCVYVCLCVCVMTMMMVMEKGHRVSCASSMLFENTCSYTYLWIATPAGSTPPIRPRRFDPDDDDEDEDDDEPGLASSPCVSACVCGDF